MTSNKKPPANDWGRGPNPDTVKDPNYKKEFKNKLYKAFEEKFARRALFRRVFQELDIHTTQYARLMSLLPSGEKPSNANKSAIIAKIKEGSLEDFPANRRPRSASQFEIVAAMLLLEIKKQGYDPEKITFDEHGNMILPPKDP